MNQLFGLQHRRSENRPLVMTRTDLVKTISQFVFLYYTMMHILFLLLFH